MAITHAQAQIVYRPEKNIQLTLEQSTAKVTLLSHCSTVKASIRKYKDLYGAEEKQAEGLKLEAEKLENVLLNLAIPHKTSVDDRLKNVDTNLQSLQERLIKASTALAGNHIVSLAANGNAILAEADAKAADLKKMGDDTMQKFAKGPKPTPVLPPEKPKSFFERWCCCFNSEKNEAAKPLLQPVADSGLENGNGVSVRNK